mmetsp:Transcript_11402/g.27840  ORF Transcript_11402/g.27840 Transcript_11402/m.27840 type:complete len:213 (+) Transcript_11402:1621-2259(+)
MYRKEKYDGVYSTLILDFFFLDTSPTRSDFSFILCSFEVKSLYLSSASVTGITLRGTYFSMAAGICFQDDQSLLFASFLHSSMVPTPNSTYVSSNRPQPYGRKIHLALRPLRPSTAAAGTASCGSCRSFRQINKLLLIHRVCRTSCSALHEVEDDHDALLHRYRQKVIFFPENYDLVLSTSSSLGTPWTQGQRWSRRRRVVVRQRTTCPARL